MGKVNAEKTLSEIKTLENEIELKKQELKKIKDLGVDDYSETAKRKQVDIIKYIGDCVNRIEYITSLIDNVEGAKYKSYLVHRFILHKTQEDIAEDMGYSVAHIYRIAKQAIKAFEKVLKSNT